MKQYENVTTYIYIIYISGTKLISHKISFIPKYNVTRVKNGVEQFTFAIKCAKIELKRVTFGFVMVACDLICKVTLDLENVQIELETL